MCRLASSIITTGELSRGFFVMVCVPGVLGLDERGSSVALSKELLSHSVRITPLHFVEARLVNQPLTLGEGCDQPSTLFQHALIAQCTQRRLHALHRGLKSCVGVQD